MQDERNRPWERLAPESPAYQVQKRVLLELVVDPPADGDRLSVLVERLELPSRAVEAAVEALVVAGLAHQHEGRVYAAPSALYFEFLWPVML